MHLVISQTLYDQNATVKVSIATLTLCNFEGC